jgi:hypothetical protein
VISLLVLTVVSVSISACDFFFAKSWYLASYPFGVRLVGTEDRDRGGVGYFSIRVGDPNSDSIAAGCPLVFHWRGARYMVCEIHPNDVGLMGASVEETTEGGDRMHKAFLVGGEGRDYVVEFYFRNERIYHFYGWHRRPDPAICPFGLSFGSNEIIRLPVKGGDMQRAFGAPDSVVAIPGK